MTATHIRIDIDLHKPLKVASAQAGVSIQKFASDLIRKELKIQAKGRTNK